MAGEKKGKAYEALVYVALEQLIASGDLAGPLHWNVTPKAMSIEPDLMTGKDPDSPKTILLLSHSGSAKESEKKMWRNLGELVEAKTVLPLVPRVYCLTFGVIKADLEPIQQHAFDQFVWVRPATHPWVAELDEFISSCVEHFPKGQEAQKEYMREAVKAAGSKAKASFKQLKALLADMHKASSMSLDKLWSSHRLRVAPAILSPRTTAIRSGLAKLLLFPEPMEAVSASTSDRALTQGNTVEYLLDHGLIRKIGRLYKVNDTDIRSCARTLPYESLAALVDLYSAAGARWFSQLRASPQLGQMLEFMRKNFELLRTPVGMFNFIKSTHHSTAERSVGFTWGYYRSVDAIKIGAGFRQGYGLAQLLADISKARVSRGYSEQVAKIAGIPVSQIRFRAPRSIERLLSVQLGDWSSPRSNQLFEDYPIDMAEVSVVLSERMKNVNPSVFNESAGFSRQIFQSNVVNGFATWRHFEPLKALIMQSIQSAKTVRVTVAFAEASAQSLREDAGRMTLLQASRTLINWQSCSDDGRDHKKKELCGRSIGLRYHWNGKAFVRRPGVEKLILVLDGTWRQADLDSLLRAGWDEIYYPDEMDLLAKAIV